jgi:ElaB/YqjD/DUF883 family membrane-anchored ribosome-binding protein
MRAHANTVKDEVQDEVSTGVRRIADNAEHMAEVANEKMKEYAGRAKDMLHEANNTSLADVEKKVGTYIKQNPGTSLLSAAAVGFVVGFLFSRR